MPIIEPIKDVADWTVDDWRGAFNTLSELYSKALARAEAAERRVAELEARLADEWRPVTEQPTEAGYYQTVNDGLYEHCYYGPNGWEDYYLPPTYWRPLTDPPMT